MKYRYQLYSIAGDPMGIFQTLSARAAKLKNRHLLFINSIFEWKKEK